MNASMISHILGRPDQPEGGLIFIDTEFTNFVDPQLISIGLIHERGDRNFYREVAPLPNGMSDFVRGVVLPLLQGGDYSRTRTEIIVALHDWVAGIPGPQHIVCDYYTDFELFADLMRYHWPGNLAGKPIMYVESELSNIHPDVWEASYLARKKYYWDGGRMHHALEDARSNRLGWLAAKARIESMTEQHTEHQPKEQKKCPSRD